MLQFGRGDNFVGEKGLTGGLLCPENKAGVGVS